VGKEDDIWFLNWKQIRRIAPRSLLGAPFPESPASSQKETQRSRQPEMDVALRNPSLDLDRSDAGALIRTD
jgi:hypothetical protein